jgi:signal transduction histidine kinase
MMDHNFRLDSSDRKLPDWHQLAPFARSQFHELSTGNDELGGFRQMLEQSAHHSAGFPSRSDTVWVTESMGTESMSTQPAPSTPDQEFLSMISHELRSPLANIQMAIDLLRTALEQSGVLQNSAHKVADYFRLLDSECRREIGLINNLLDLARVEAIAQPLELVTIDLNQWLSYLAEAFIERAEMQQKQFILDLPSALPLTQTNPPNLEGVLSELFHNALKYTPPGERIVLSARHYSSNCADSSDYSANLADAFPEAGQEIIAIQMLNTGVELSPTELPKLFDKFYRVHHPHAPESEGNGLGLALVQRRVTNLGGRITVESSHQQVCFTIQLPL